MCVNKFYKFTFLNLFVVHTYLIKSNHEQQLQTIESANNQTNLCSVSSAKVNKCRSPFGDHTFVHRVVLNPMCAFAHCHNFHKKTFIRTPNFCLLSVRMTVSNMSLAYGFQIRNIFLSYPWYFEQLLNLIFRKKCQNFGNLKKVEKTKILSPITLVSETCVER